MEAMSEIEHWLSDGELDEIYSAAYWNDIDEERSKPWWIEDGDYDRCRRYLDESQLLQEYLQAELLIRELPNRRLQVLDLAAGIGWTSALLSKIEQVERVHCVEISRHRLERLFPHCVAMFDGQPQKIRRYLGSFYRLQLPDESMDVIFMSQAFHHADRPLQLLAESDRVLKPGGRMLLLGEHTFAFRTVVRRFLRTALRERRLVTDFHRLFPPDPVLGDHYYRRSDYYLLFGAMGYRVRHRLAATGNMLYVADKSSNRTMSKA